MEIENHTNNLEHKIKIVLDAANAGNFIYSTQTAGVLAISDTKIGTIHGVGVASSGLILGTTASGTFFATGTTNRPLSTSGIGADDPRNLWAMNNGTAVSGVGVSTTAPQKPLFIDNCSRQFFTETGLGNQLTTLFKTNDLTGVVTAPNLLNEYHAGSVTAVDILFKNNWQILKTDIVEDFRSNIGESETIAYIAKNRVLGETGFIITDDKGAIKKIITNGLNYLRSWDLVIVMVLKKIIDWFKAEEIYNTKYKMNGRYQNFLIPLPISTTTEKYYKSLQQYYTDNQCNIDAKFEKLIK